MVMTVVVVVVVVVKLVRRYMCDRRDMFDVKQNREISTKTVQFKQ